ncbi:hypothetical protein CLU79DRAFT_752089 [Phycomyces nitens]|nr:hypothetical protein CLU79DRAFT_752089 [Phycomyces nitens]
MMQRLPLVIGIVVFLLLSRLPSWTKVDHDIINVLDDIKRINGKPVDLYTWLDIPPTASPFELNAILRRRTVEWHPSTNPQYVSEFACLEKAAPLLRNPASRERVDYFRVHDVPSWRGFSYHLKQCRSNFWAMSALMILITGIMEYISVYLAYLQEAHQLDQFIKSSQKVIKSTRRRPTSGIQKSYIDLGDRVLDCRIRSDQTIWVVNDQGQEVLFGSDLIKRPSMTENIFWIRWPAKLQKVLFFYKKQ